MEKIPFEGLIDWNLTKKHCTPFINKGFAVFLMVLINGTY
jgi:hypothetical protein